jgi:MYXO-CTERM domain-containing protein
MRDLGSELCSVCQEQFVRSFWSFENVQMIETATPEQATVQLDACEPLALSVTSPPLTPSTYRYTWSVDGKQLSETTSSVQLEPGTLTKGSHEVDLLVEDATPLVRHDPDGLLKEEHSWTVNVSRDDCMGALGGAGGAADAGSAGSNDGGVGGALGGVGGALGGAGAAATAGASGVASGGVASALAGSSSGGVTTRPVPPPEDSSGCGCSVPGSGSGSRALASATLLALGLLMARRRSADAQHAGEHRAV